MNNSTSILIGQILGILYLAVGIGMFVSRSHYEKLMESFKSSPSLIYLGGAMALVVGTLILKFHSIWTLSWELLISAIGVMAFIKGLLLLIVPVQFLGIIKVGYIAFARWLAVGLGLLFCCLSF